jgi:hypothetical protein
LTGPAAYTDAWLDRALERGGLAPEARVEVSEEPVSPWVLASLAQVSVAQRALLIGRNRERQTAGSRTVRPLSFCLLLS